MRNPRRFPFSLVAVTALIGIATTACAVRRTPTDVLSGSGPLVVASDLDNPPFAEIDPQGRCVGRDVEMMERVAAELHRPIEWRRLPFLELLPAAERGDVDVVCATLGITPERAQRVAFSVPYFETEIAVVVRSGADEPHRLADLDGRRVSAGAGTTAERAVTLRLPRAVGVFENESGLATLERLTSREVDAVALDAPSAEALIRRSAGALVRLREHLGAESYALVLPKTRSDLIAAVNRVLLRMQEQGDLRRLDATYALRQRATDAKAR